MESLTRSLEEAKIKRIIEISVTNGRGYSPRSFNPFPDIISQEQLYEHLRAMNEFDRWAKFFENPTNAEVEPDWDDPDRRPLYFCT